MIRKYAFYIISWMFFVSSIPAYADYRSDDSCLEQVEVFEHIGQAISTLGISEAISAAFRMKDGPGTEEEEITNPADPSGKKVQRCKVATSDVKFRYKSLTTDSYNTWRAGESGWFDLIVRLHADTVADKICIKAFMGVGGFRTLGCKYRPDPASVSLKTACYVSTSCIARASQFSKSLFPLSSSVVQCVEQSLRNFFWNSDNQCTGAQSKLENFQNAMRRAIIAAITLYVMFFFMRVMIGSELPRKGEVFTFIIKGVLVIYFSVGFSGSSPVRGQILTGNGVGDIFHISTSATASLSSMMLRAGSSSGICQYNNSLYPKGWEILGLFDALDCRVLFYLGMNQIGTDVGSIAAEPAKAAVVVASRLLQYFFPSIFAFNILFAIMCLVLGIFILSVSVYIVHTYIIAMIAMALVAYLAPIFVPMALFNVTKSYYQKWLSILMGYTFQPMVLFAFMGLMFTIFDEIMYPGCEFETLTLSLPGKDYASSPNVNVSIDGVNTPSSGTAGIVPLTNIPYFHMKTPVDSNASKNWSLADIDRCRKSFGFFMSKPVDLITVPALFFNLPLIFPHQVASFFTSMISMVVFMFLFYYFVNMLSGLAMDLVGGTAIGNMAVAPTYLFDKAKGLAEKVVDAKTGGAASKKTPPGSQATRGSDGGSGSGGGTPRPNITTGSTPPAPSTTPGGGGRGSPGANPPPPSTTNGGS